MYLLKIGPVAALVWSAVALCLLRAYMSVLRKRIASISVDR
jgi:hypothetical protein